MSVVAHRFALSRPLPPTLGLGAFLKNTVCAIDGRAALLSRDVGNLDTVEAIRGFEATVGELLERLPGRPRAVAHDLHPDFHSTRYAYGLGVETVAVQHHHAHVAAVMAEHGIESPVLGLALDGFGLGPGNESWGGELLRVDRQGYARLGRLYRLKQPGGDAAARQPWRMGAAALHALGRDGEIATRFAAMPGAGVIARLLSGSVNAPETSSCGRLFDAACGLLGVRLVAAFEGEAPMELERMAAAPRVLDGGWRVDGDGVLDCRPLLDALAGMDAVDGANAFHGTLAAALVDWAARAARSTGIATVALCGGCFLNKVLTARVFDGLRSKDLNPLLPMNVTPGDGAVSLGQAWATAVARG